MTWRLVPIIGLVALLCPVVAKAQTNLDQGKTPSQIFANACVECHKEPRGLARGRSASALTDFLREHYTTNGQQAASLAAYKILLEQKFLKPSDKVVLFNTGSGLKYIDVIAQALKMGI